MTRVAPPPRPVEGAISWNLNTACNYRCSYCTQRFMDDRGRWSRETPRFLAAFARLPGPWEVKISGGEPFVHPTLCEIVAGLAGLGHRLSIVTNFSATRARLEAFLDAAAGRVGVFSASLHLEYVDDVDAFIARGVWVAEELARRRAADVPAPHFNVTTVATRTALPRLEALAARFAAAGLVFKVQPEKQDGAAIAYDAGEEALLVQLGGHNRTGRLVNRFTGAPCWAGARYFILDDLGRAWRCYPARREKRERLGDFLDPDFRPWEEARPCGYRSCDCTVPIARGMMARAEESVG
jgi:MoaA/NifB/PqqE/SkfB family radical SAM enzyme